LEGGQVTISAQKIDGRAEILVEDNAGTYCDKLSDTGLGMNLVDKRIKNQFGPECGVEVSCEPDQKTRVLVRIPLAKEDFA
jgi:two-component system LytT family sensor kinase